MRRVTFLSFLALAVAFLLAAPAAAGEIERREAVTVTVPISTSASANTYLGSGMVLAGIELPAAFTATTANVVITGYFSAGGDTTGTALAIKDYSGDALSESVVVVAATNTNRFVYLAADSWETVNVIKITLTTSDGTTPVVQAAARTITAIVRPY